ncbi:hypothetical protein [Tetragenococcus solitarius]|uniref:DUF4298 domain-containing protein n=1 Tax=Tetragenococcus solitarius TaxID=71453 RepID=A0ABN3YCY2_9ENTE|nr:hypothetical protein [Tetragenococcus solitarius]
MEREKLTKNKQPIKAVTQQDIHHLKGTLEKLQSWTNALEMLDKFFKYEKEPLNKKQVILEYHANSQIFDTFLKDFLTQTHLLEDQLEELRSREKIGN